MIGSMQPSLDSVELIGLEKIMFKNEHTLVARKLPKGPTLELSRYIELTPELAWAIGFFLAEGSKTYSGIGVANCDASLVLKFKKTIDGTFEGLSEKWRAYIKTSDNDNEGVKRRWTDRLDMRNVNVNFASLAREDNVELRLNNTFFSAIFNTLAKKAMPLIQVDRELMLKFLDGYEVGDGSIIQRNGYLYGVVITVKDATIKDFLVETFKLVYGQVPAVRRTRGCYEVQFRGVHTITQMIVDEQFRSSKRQWKKLLGCYLKKEYARTHVRYWTTLSGGPLEITDIARLTERSHWSVRDAMNKDVKYGLVALERRHVKGRMAPYFNFYDLTARGRTLIKFLKEAEACKETH
jgi:hypothetical protein